MEEAEYNLMRSGKLSEHSMRVT
jgi:WD40 repeat protein